jgi:MFS family permease
MAQISDSARLGPIWLQPGVRPRHVLSLFFGAFTTIGLLTFIALTTPYVLTVGLHIPQGEQGAISGDLHVWQELATLLAFGPIGLIADRIGRRQVYAGGMLLMGIGYALYSFSSSVPELMAYRLIYAVGVAAATAMLGTVVADYPENRSRGIAVAITGVLNAIGIICVTVGLGRLPEIFVSRGAEAAAAGHYANFIVAGLCFLTALVLAVGLRPGLPVTRTVRPPFRELARRAFAETRNPRIGLAYAAGFIMRAQLVILGTFTVLWGTTAALDQGMNPSEALAKGRLVFAIPSAAALLWQLFVMTWLLDRVNRVTGVVICTALGVAGYVGTLFIHDPLARESWPLLILLGIGQISTFSGTTTLISQEAPAEARASVIGMFNMFGAAGILLSTFVGGRLFDSIRPAAPFVFIGSLTAIVFVLAVICRVRAPGEGVGRRPAAVPASGV